MIVRKISEIEKTERDVIFNGGNSQRLLIKKDGMDFALMKTNVKKGGPYYWHYPYHQEACYCVSGLGILTDLKTNKTHIIEPDTMYALNNHDKHSFKALEDTVLISVFTPPLRGNETHNENGQYK